MPCPTCNNNLAEQFVSKAVSNEDNGLVFVIHNNWSIGSDQEIIALTTIRFVILFILMVNIIPKLREAVLDEAAQETSDYIIKVRNPSADVLNPEEWNIFFSQL